MNLFRLKACTKCRGDLLLDEGDWLCLQCGTYYYTGLYRPAAIPDLPHEQPDQRDVETKTAIYVAGGPLTGQEDSSPIPDLPRPVPAADIQQIAASASVALQT
jgi:hypothetical protein